MRNGQKSWMWPWSWSYRLPCITLPAKAALSQTGIQLSSKNISLLIHSLFSWVFFSIIFLDKTVYTRSKLLHFFPKKHISVAALSGAHGFRNFYSPFCSACLLGAWGESKGRSFYKQHQGLRQCSCLPVTILCCPMGTVFLGGIPSQYWMPQCCFWNVFRT